MTDPAEQMRETWSEWVAHDDTGLPAGLKPRSIVQVRLGNDELVPMWASEIDWEYPSNPVTEYRVKEGATK